MAQKTLYVDGEDIVKPKGTLTDKERALIKLLNQNPDAYATWPRTPAQVDADERFLQGFVDTQILRTLPKLRNWLIHKGGTFKYLISKTVKEMELPAGIYEIYGKENAALLNKGTPLLPAVPEEGVRVIGLISQDSRYAQDVLFGLPDGSLVKLWRPTGVVVPASNQPNQAYLL